MSDLSISRSAQYGAPALSEQAKQCMLACGPMHRLHCAAEAVHGFLARRFVTTMVAAAGLVAASGWIFFS